MTKEKKNLTNFNEKSLTKQATEYLSCGLNPIPCNDDKSPNLKSWKKYQTEKSAPEIFVNSPKIGVICGRVSNNLTVIDIDCKNDISGNLWTELLDNLQSYFNDNFEKLCIIKTVSGGYHIPFYCDIVESNLKLANRKPTNEELQKNPNVKNIVLIETRGEGGYVIAPNSKGYEYIQGNYNNLPKLTESEYYDLKDICKSFNEIAELHTAETKNKDFEKSDWIKTPFDDFNDKNKPLDLLLNAGWQINQSNSRKCKPLLIRPGKTKGVSGGILKDTELFSNFSSSTCFDNKVYNSVQIYTILNHNSDYSAAAKELIKQGYGKRKNINFKLISKIAKQRKKQIGKTGGFENSEAAKDSTFKYLCEIENIPFEDSKDTVNKIFNNETKKINIQGKFWYEIENEKTENITLKIDITKLYDFFGSIGIKKLIVDDKDLQRILVKIENNIVSEIDIPTIQKTLFTYINNLPEQIDENSTKNDLIDVIGRGLNVYIDDNKINYYLPIIKIDFLTDSKNEAYFFFKNGFVEVDKNEIKLKNYSELKGYIWKSQIIEHEFSVNDNNKNPVIDFEFSKFTQNICTIRETQDFNNNRWVSLISSIGYLLHNHRTTANKLAVILTEANLSNDPQGGTGKGLLMQAIGKLRKVTLIDGKVFNFDTPFAYQSVELDTQIIFFDDVLKSFDFQKLYSVITEGLSFEKKHKDRINLSPEKSPKIAISTNFTIKGNSESDKRRRFEMELICYYNATYKPENEFKRQFFYDWNTEDWNMFYNFMILCCKSYFENNNSIPEYNSITIEQRKLINNTSIDFIDFADSLKLNENLNYNSTYQNYLDFAGIKEKDLSKIRFTNWLKNYCDYKNYTFKNEPVRIGEKTERVLYIYDNQ